MAITLSRRVDWPMLDLAQVVYYPRYFDLAHRFFEESWEQICGIDYATLTVEQRLGFPAVKTMGEHFAPLRYGDTVVCTMWVERVGDKSVEWGYRFSNQDGLDVWRGSVLTVCVNLDNFKSMRVPAHLAESLRACQE